MLRSAHRTSDATRTASVRIEVPNKDDRLHGGDFVEVYFDAGSSASVDNGSSRPPGISEGPKTSGAGT